jgi:hypothetical protein
MIECRELEVGQEVGMSSEMFAWICAGGIVVAFVAGWLVAKWIRS